jgi:AraC-like DNA-binding protein
MIDPHRIQQRFFEKLEGSLALASLFEYLPEVYLYVKDCDSRFIRVNEPLWRMRGCEAERDMIGLSVSQFDRRFKKLYQMTPMQYVLRVRLNAASEAISTSDRSIAEIALACGFYDQSYFTKQFRRQFAETPSAYRERYRNEGRR